MNNKIGFVLGLLCILSFQSCDESVFYRTDVETPNGWGIEQKISFNVPDLIPKKSTFYIHLRNDNSYPFANIFLIASLHQNDSLLVRDTLEYTMAHPDGSWKGSGFSAVKASKLWWRDHKEKDPEGAITVELAQANRANGEVDAEPRLPGIVSVGLSIETQED